MTGLAANAEEKVLHVYSAQKEHLIRPVLEKYEEKTGVDIKLITVSGKVLESRLLTEGAQTKADVIIATDVANLYRMGAKDLFAPAESKVLKEIVPAHLRSPLDLWYGLTIRSRVLYCRKGDAVCDAVDEYKDIAEFDGKVLIRSSNSVYNQSLLASFISHIGAEKAKEWAGEVASRFARKPTGGDKDQLRALASGLGDIAVSNTYYFGLLSNSPDESDRDYAKKLQLILPNQGEHARGAHVNIRGIAMSKYSKYPEETIKLMEYLVQPDAQAFFANHNYEFPINKDVEPADFMKPYAGAKFDTIALEKIGELNSKAVEIFDAVSWP
ncbi:MAG: extracellular solute-binding protein [Rickettsiales bacterium]|nr:extracellular solute-binding protein [Rickettsiales bacterium]